MQFEDQEIQCPYCGETIWLEIDPSESDQQNFVYDCEVCCRPIQVSSFVNEFGNWQTLVRTDA